MTGRGEMTQRIGSTDAGALLERMLPYLRREAYVGDFTTQQAFARMMIRFNGTEGLIRRAAELFQPDFNAALADVHRGEDYLRLMAAVERKLTELAESAAADAEKRRLFEEFCTTIKKHRHGAEPQPI
jgi:hypothetical protein